MTKEYTIVLNADNSKALAALRQVGTEVKRLDETHVQIKTEMDLKAFQSALDRVLKNHPKIKAELDYQIKKDALKGEQERLSKMTANIDTSAAKKRLSDLASQIDDFDKKIDLTTDPNQEETLMDQQDITKAKFREELNRLYSSTNGEQAVKDLDDVTKRVMDFHEIKPEKIQIDTSEIDQAKSNISTLEKELASLRTQYPDIDINVDTSKAKAEINDLKEDANNVSAKIMFHTGNLESGSKGEPFEDMLRHMLTNRFNEPFTDQKKQGILQNIGYGWIGTGTYATTDYYAVPGVQEGDGVDDRKNHILNIDPEKYHLLPANLSEQQADAVAKSLSDVQAYALYKGVNFDGHDDLKAQLDQKYGSYTPESIYNELKAVIPDMAMSLKDFSSFMTGAIDQVRGVYGSGFDEEFRPNQKQSDRSRDSVTTQLLRKLGYGGVDFSGTDYDSYEHGISIFDLDKNDVLKSFDNNDAFYDYVEADNYQENIKKLRAEHYAPSERGLKDIGDGADIKEVGEAAKNAADDVDRLADAEKRLHDSAGQSFASSDEVNRFGTSLNEASNSVDNFGDAVTVNSSKVDSLGDSSEQASGEIDKFAASAKDTTSAFRELDDSSSGTSAKIEHLGDSAEQASQPLKDLGTIDASKLVTTLGDADKVLSQIGKTASTTVNNINRVVTSMNNVEHDKAKIQNVTSGLLSADQKEYQRAIAAYNNMDAAMQSTVYDKIVQQNQNAKRQLDRIVNDKNSPNRYMSDYLAQIKSSSAALEESHKTLAPNNFRSTFSTYDSDYAKNYQAAQLLLEQKNSASNRKSPTGQQSLKSTVGRLLEQSTSMSPEYKARAKGIYSVLNSGELSTADVSSLKAQYLGLEAEVRRAGQSGKSFLDEFTGRIKSGSAQFLAQYFGIQDFINYGRQALEVVVDLDTKMTELRKVSDATDTQLANAFKKSSTTAESLGATVSDVVSATADWSRLGYNLQDSEEMARVATLYKNVGDGISMDQANSYLVSVMQGYQMPATSAESIVDQINEVANNFPIDTGGIGEALQRSAASFNAANTSLAQSIALVTGTVSVTQDPTSAGTLWKTLSARMRGADSELTAMGEESDSYVTSKSKLRDLVKGMTGFDIMKDENTFKSIYDIVVGIADKWHSLSDINQASLLEALAGKRNANALAATIQNIDLVKRAYATAQNSAGSAATEQENYTRSIQYSIDRLKATAQTGLAGFFKSDMMKGFIEGGNQILGLITKVTTALGPLGTAITVVSTALSVKGGPSLLSYNKDTQKWSGLLYSAGKGFGQARKYNKTPKVVQEGQSQYENPVTGFFQGAVNYAKDVRTGKKNNRAAYETIRNTVNTDNFDSVKDAIKNRNYSQFPKIGESLSKASESARNYVSEMAEASTSTIQLKSAMEGGIQGSLTFGESLARIGKSLIANAASAGVAAFAMVGVQLAITAISKAIVTNKEALEASNAMMDNYKSNMDTFRQHASTISQISSTYEQLAKGVDTSNNKNLSLDSTEYSQFLDVSNQIADMYPDLVSGFDAQGNAILSLKGNVDGLTQSLLKEKNAAYNSAWQENPDIENSGWSSIFQSYASVAYAPTDKGSGTWWQRIGNSMAKNYASQTDGYMSTWNLLTKGDTKGTSENTDAIQKAIDSAGHEKSQMRRDMDTLKSLDLSKDEDRNKAAAIVGTTADDENLAAKITEKYQADNNQLEERAKNVRSAMEGYMKGTSLGYAKLSTNGQSMASDMINNLPTDLFDGMNKDPDKMQSFVDDLVRKIQSGGSKLTDTYKTVQSSLKDGASRLTVSDLTNLNKQVESISKATGVSTDNLKDMFNIPYIDGTIAQFEEVNKGFSSISGSAEDMSAKIGNMLGLNRQLTMGEIHQWNLVAQGANSAAEAVKKYNAATIEKAIDNPSDKGFLSLVDEGGKYNSAVTATSDDAKANDKGATYAQMYSMLKEGKSLNKHGKVGTNEFKAIAKMFSPTGSSSDSGWDKNVSTYAKFFTKDESGLDHFLSTLQQTEVAGDKLASYSKTTGEWSINISDAAAAAKKLGIGVEPLAALMDNLDAHGFKTNYIASAADGWAKLGDQTVELTKNRAKLTGQTKELNKIEDKYGKNSSKYKKQSAKVEATKDKIQDNKEDIDQTRTATRKMIRKEANETKDNRQADATLISYYDKEIAAQKKKYDSSKKTKEDTDAYMGAVGSLYRARQEKANTYEATYGQEYTHKGQTNTEINKKLTKQLESAGFSKEWIENTQQQTDYDSMYLRGDKIYISGELQDGKDNSKGDKDNSKGSDSTGKSDDKPSGETSKSNDKDPSKHHSYIKDAHFGYVKKNSDVADARKNGVTGLTPNSLSTWKASKYGNTNTRMSSDNYMQAGRKSLDNGENLATARLKFGTNSKITQQAAKQDVQIEGVIRYKADVQGVNEDVARVVDKDGSVHYVAKINGVAQEVEPVLDQNGNITYRAKTTEVGTKIEAVKNQDGTISYFAKNIDGVTQEVSTVKNQDGTVSFVAATGQVVATVKKLPNPQRKVNYSMGKQPNSGDLKTLAGKAKYSGLFPSSAPTLKGVINYAIGTLPSIVQKLRGHASGTLSGFSYGTISSFATGTQVSVPDDTNAVVNELGEEGLIRDGMMTIIPGGMQMMHLRRGDIIVNHKQLEQLRSGQPVTANGGRGRLIGSFANGTIPSFAGGTSKGKKTWGASSSSSSNSKKKKSHKHDDDNTKATKANTAAKKKDTDSTKKSTKAKKSATEKLQDMVNNLYDWIEVWIDRVDRTITNKTNRAEQSVQYGRIRTTKSGRPVAVNSKGNSTETKKVKTKKGPKRVKRAIDAQDATGFRYQSGSSSYRDMLLAYTSAQNTAARSAVRSQSSAAAYRKALNSIVKYTVKGKGKLSSKYQKLVKNGDYDRIQKELKSDGFTRTKIDAYKEWYEKYLNAKDKQIEWEKQVSELEYSKLDAVQAYYEASRASKEAAVDVYNARLSEADKAGIQRSGYYSKIISSENRIVSSLKAEQSAMSKRLAKDVKAGRVSTGSNEYKTRKANIDKLSSDIASHMTNIYDAQNTLNNLSIEANTSLRAIHDSIVDKINALISLANAHDNIPNVSLYRKSITQDMDSYYLDKNSAERQLANIKRNFASGGVWATELGKRLSAGQQANVAKYVANDDISGLGKYLRSLGVDFNRLTGFQEAIKEYNATQTSYLSLAKTIEDTNDARITDAQNYYKDVQDQLSRIKNASEEALSLQEAVYNLNKAQNNKNVRTWNGKEWVYASDVSEVKSAQKNLDDTNYNNLINAIDRASQALDDLAKQYNLFDDNGNPTSNWNKIFNTVVAQVGSNVALINDYLKKNGYNVKLQTFSTGGVVSSKGVNDNTLIRVSDKERILTPEQNALFEELISNQRMLITIDPFDNLLKSMARNTPVTQTKSHEIHQVFNITLPNVTDSTKAEDLMRELQSLSTKKIQYFNR